MGKLRRKLPSESRVRRPLIQGNSRAGACRSSNKRAGETWCIGLPPDVRFPPRSAGRGGGLPFLPQARAGLEHRCAASGPLSTPGLGGPAVRPFIPRPTSGLLSPNPGPCSLMSTALSRTGP